MAEKQTEIIFEYPDDADLPADKDVVKEEAASAEPVVENDIEIEVEDDTPPEDRNKEPLPQNLVEELESDPLTDYSERVKQRLSQMKKVWHDERRAKEAAAREREEAIRFAQQIAEENKKLKATLSSGEEEYLKTLKQALELELATAKRDYRDAHDTGDTDKIVEAQQRMNDAQFRLIQASSYNKKYESENALQEQENPVYIEPSKPQKPQISEKDRTWQEKNTWFGQNRQMTSFALGLHEDLVEEGFVPGSDEYYRRVDIAGRSRFQDYFGDATLDEEKPAQRTKPSTVVAPATRSTAPKKVKLTTSQLALAKKFGLTPEQYAREITKLETR